MYLITFLNCNLFILNSERTFATYWPVLACKPLLWQRKDKWSIRTNSAAMSHVHEFLCAAFIEEAPVVLHFMRSHRLPEGLSPRVKGEVGNHRGISSDWTLNTYSTLLYLSITHFRNGLWPSHKTRISEYCVINFPGFIKFNLAIYNLPSGFITYVTSE